MSCVSFILLNDVFIFVNGTPETVSGDIKLKKCVGGWGRYAESFMTESKVVRLSRYFFITVITEWSGSG